MAARLQSESSTLGGGVCPRRFTQTERITLWLFLVAAVVLRFLFLGRADLWQDEMLFVNLSDIRMTPFQVWAEYWNRWLVGMAWLPLPGFVQNAYMRLVHAWVPTVMHDPFWARIPGAVFGSVAVPVAFLAYRRAADRATVITATLLMCCTVFPVFYSRELHAYPLLLLSSAGTLLLFLAIVSGPCSKMHYVGFALASLVQFYTHLTSLMFYAALCVTVFFFWAWMRYKEKSVAESNRLFNFGLFCAVIGLAAVPILLKVLGGDSPHLAEESGMSFVFMLNDAVAKLFLGDHWWASLLAWIVLAWGIWGLFKAGVQGRVVVSIAALSLLFVCLSAKKTQYLSVRYFTVAVPALLLVFAAGLNEIGRKMDAWRKGHRPAVAGWGLAGILVSVHLFVFLPPIYRLRAKSVDFGRIARWLNEHLEPGTPYVMYSAYELRLVPGYFDTPGLVAASPYVHGGTMEERQRLYHYQKDFLLKFPEAPYIESDGGSDLWTWPASYFAQQIRLTNEPLRQVVKMGIYPTLFRAQLTDGFLVTTVYRNTLHDRLASAAREGDAFVLDYTASTCVPVAQAEQGRATLYARFWNGPEAGIELHVLPGRHAEGVLRFSGAVAAPAGEYIVALFEGTNVLNRQKMPSGRFVSWAIPVALDATSLLRWRVEGMEASMVQGLAMADVQYATGIPAK